MLSTLNAHDFRQLILSGTACLETNVDAINALNVFPVPDGDTGINMLLTLRSASDAQLPDPSAATIGIMSSALARGALLGARGNSGVIFSQFMKGLASTLAEHDECDAETLAAALLSAANAGYQAVGTPVEGTMLTVMRAAAEAVQTSDIDDLEGVLRTAYEAAERALAYTPEQLPVLKQAGVVDAGGQGLVAFLAGALGFVSGVHLEILIASPQGAVEQVPTDVSQEFLEHTADEMYGYCTQFVVEGDRLDPDNARIQVMNLATSTVVVGDDRVVRVHAHVSDPGPLLSLGAAMGSLDQINIQNMDLQHQDFMAQQGYAPSDTSSFAIVAIAAGDGMHRLFADLGVHAMVQGGQSMNPSSGDILEGVTRANAAFTVVLPNNKNIVLAAEQARDLADRKIAVIPTTSVPQGIAAMLAYNPDFSDSENVEAMSSAIPTVQSGEVTIAVRSAVIEDVEVEQGHALAVLDGKLVASASSTTEALLEMLRSAAPQDGSLVTLYHGAAIDPVEVSSAEAAIASHFPEIEIEVHEGGQPYYQYIVSVE